MSFDFEYHFKFHGRTQGKFRHAHRHSGVFSLVSENLDGQIGRPVHDEGLRGEILRDGHVTRHPHDSLHALQIAKGRFRLRDGVQKTKRGAFLSLFDTRRRAALFPRKSSPRP